MNKLTIADLDVKGKRVLLRVDFNVPLDESGQISDNTRILSALPTIQYLLNGGARLIILSHLGRPNGKPAEVFSLRPVAEMLGNILKQQVFFSPALIGPVARTAIDCLKDGDCLLMENVRFYPEEEKNDVQFSKELASLAELYVNDAFGAAHRAHASNEGVTRFFDKAACGFLVEKELLYLENLIRSPEAPFCAIIGGAKVKDKIHVIGNLLNQANEIIIGGGMAYTFLHAQGKGIGNSILDNESSDLVAKTFARAASLDKTIHLPTDHVIAESFSNDVPTRIVENDIPEGYMGLDIGPKSVADFLAVIDRAKTIFWNGPMGIYEIAAFAKGSIEIARAIGESKAFSVIGGGDSIAAVNSTGMADKISHICTGGGASLKFLEKGILPGIEVLKK
ncbi:MAG: phosphoglycerate kinase [SAR324 cluster bacterium]|nr:phosphoglycerate kinase [SAR324 cluster bacterium]